MSYVFSFARIALYTIFIMKRVKLVEMSALLLYINGDGMGALREHSAWHMALAE